MDTSYDSPLPPLSSSIDSDGSISSSSNHERRDSDGSINNHERRIVTFDVVQIREYELTIGDNPSVSSGAPISLSWCYYPECQIISLDEYESERELSRRDKCEMRMPHNIRRDILMDEWGISSLEYFDRMRNIIDSKEQRNRTIANMRFERIEEKLEGIRKIFSRRKRIAHSK